MRILVAGAAAIALAAGGAYAAPGKGQGNDKQNNDRGAAQLERVQPDTGRANSVRQRAKPDTERRDNRRMPSIRWTKPVSMSVDLG